MQNTLQPSQERQWSPPRGIVLMRALRNDPTQEYLLYVPRHAAPNAPVLVSVHGVSRNAHEQAASFSELCETHNVVLLVPIFTVDHHQDYQRLGREGRGPRADKLLDRQLLEVARLTGADVSQFYMFGFSAGAQFAHRYLMAHPHRVARASLAAAGWYTFPDSRERFPYGIRTVRKLPGVNFNPEQFLRVPIKVLIGSLDEGAANLRRTDRCDAQQGTTRLERAHNWVTAMRESATQHDMQPQVTLEEVPGVDHSFASLCKNGELVNRIGQFLFDGLGAESRRTPNVVGIKSRR